MSIFVPSVQLAADMIRWEGLRLSVYPDSLGLPTQGVGRHSGINFGDPDITDQTAYQWLATDLQVAYSGAIGLFPSIESFDLVRKEAITSVVFNMGAEKLSQFGPFVKRINSQEWDEAAFHILTNMKGHITPYVLQVGARAEETALRICSGNILKEFSVV
jgi:GH24 family phage-related lysozyme (muramidase)